MHKTVSVTCANGEECVAYAQLGEPAKLSRYNEEDVCSACSKRKLDEEVAAASGVPQPAEASTPEGKGRRRRRRPNGAGSIYLRPDGRWQARYFDASGKRRVVYARSEQMVRLRLAAAMAERDSSSSPESIRSALDFDPEELLQLADVLQAAEKRLRRVAWLLYGADD
jgi:hypothetical protein